MSHDGFAFIRVPRTPMFTAHGCLYPFVISFVLFDIAPADELAAHEGNGTEQRESWSFLATTFVNMKQRCTFNG